MTEQHDDHDRDDDRAETPPRPRRGNVLPGPGAEPEPLRFGGDAGRDTSGDHRTFVIDDTAGEPLTDVLHAYRPKQWVILQLAKLDGADQIEMFLDEVLDEASAAYLRARFEDRDDDLDVDCLAGPIEGLTGLWYGRPTGRPGGSSRQPSRSGRRSTVRRR